MSLERLPSGGVEQAARTLLAATWGSVVALLAVIVGRLASSPLPRSFGIADALASVLYLAAFLPNVLVALFSVGMGATVTIGAQVNAGGEVVGPIRDHSLFEWGRGDPPVALLFLVAVPLVVTVGAGVRASRRASSDTELVRSLAISSVLVAVAVVVLASVADARLGGGLVKQGGVGLVAVNALQAGVLALLWCALGGAAGAGLERALRKRSKGTSS
jgi:hypothetical protein